VRPQTLLFHCALIIGAGCAPAVRFGTYPTPVRDTLIERSMPARPEWTSNTPESPEYQYFRGEGEDLKREDARAKALADVLQAYSLNLGAEFRLLTSLHREEIKQIQDEVYRTSGQVVTEAEAFARISTRGMDFRTDYWEKWSRGNEYTFYRYWLLGRVEKTFIADERRRIDSLVRASPPDPISTSDLSLSVQEEKGRYRGGDTVQIVLRASDDCYYYYLDFGGAKVWCQHSGHLEKDRPCRLVCVAQYGGSRLEALRFIASDKPLDTDEALAKVYPAPVVDDLRRQAQELGARYTEKEISIIIEPGR